MYDIYIIVAKYPEFCNRSHFLQEYLLYFMAKICDHEWRIFLAGNSAIQKSGDLMAMMYILFNGKLFNSTIYNRNKFLNTYSRITLG